MTVKYCQIFILLSALQGCDREPEFGKEAFAASRPCIEIKFTCLPESRNPEWISKWGSIQMTERYHLGPDDKEAQENTRVLVFKDEMIELIQEAFPDYWQGVDRNTRLAWLDSAIEKVDDYGFDKNMNGIIQFIELLFRLGLEFDQDPSNQKLVEFLRDEELPDSARVSESVDYVDWVLLDRELDALGREISIWGMRDILRVMPMPKKRPPELPTQRN